MAKPSSFPGAPNSRGCDGFRRMSRRQAVQAGVFGALGLSLGDMLRLRLGLRMPRRRRSPPQPVRKASSPPRPSV